MRINIYTDTVLLVVPIMSLLGSKGGLMGGDKA